MLLTAFVSLFIASKNQEVEPLSLRDIRSHFMHNQFSKKDILKKEKDIRKSCLYVNEVPTMFDFIMIFLKMWKLGCQAAIKNESEFYLGTYNFLCSVEAVCYDYTKSVLIDGNLLKYSPSILVSSLVSGSIEVVLRNILNQQVNHKLYHQSIQTCNDVWDKIVSEVFGFKSIKYIDELGKYVILR